MFILRSKLPAVVAALPLFLWALGLPLKVQAAPTFVHANAPDLPQVARGVPMGGALRVFDLNLDQSGQTTLELTRFEVFAPDATIEVVDGPSVTVPGVAYFRGTAANDPESVVMLAVPEDGKGKVHGVVTGSLGAWMVDSGPGNSGLMSRKVDLGKELAGRTFQCGADGSQIPGATAASTGAASASADTTSAGLGGTLPVNVQYTAHMIIDTDYEYWQKFWNMFSGTADGTIRAQQAAAAATEYLGDLIGYASAAYEPEVDTNLVIQHARLFADNSDPYSANTNACGCDGAGKLDEVQDVWDGNATPRTLVHFISGKTEGCGCAYTGDNNGVLCSQASGYGASSDIGTGFSIDSPGFLWEGMVIAHEIGHNFGSPHTHAYCNIGGNANPVDECADGAGDCTHTAGNLPGLGSLSGGQTSDHPGTIMSYCHQQLGSYTNIAHTFGLTHPYGIAAYRVPDHMLINVQASAACMAVQFTDSDLRVYKDCKPDDPMTAGGTATCTITVENLGPGLAHGVLSVDQFVSNGSFSFGTVTATKGSTAMPNGTCTTTTNPQNGAGTVTCNLDLIDVGHAVVIKVPVTANTPQNINDRVTVSSDSPDPNKTNNVAEDEVNVVAAQADVALAKTCKPDKNPLLAGETATCTIVATNFGPSAASNVMMTDTLVSNGSFNYMATAGSGFTTCAPSTSTASSVTVAPATSSTVTCTTATLAANATAIATVTIVSNYSVDVNDMASVTSSTNDPVTANNSVGPVGVSFGASTDLGLTKTAPATVVAGTQMPYTLTVTNNGPSAAVNTLIEDVVPAGVSIVSVTSSSTNPHNCGAGVPGDVNQPSYCKFDTIASGGTETMDIVVFVLPGTTGILHNTGTASSDATDTNNANDSASATTTVTQEPGLSVTKTDTPDPVAAGADLEYWLTVSNGGPSTATQVVLTDTLPTEVTFQSAVDGNGNTICAHSAGLVTCNLGTLSPSTAVQVFIKVRVSAAVPKGTTMSNTATVVSLEDPTGATDTEDTLVIAVADLWIDKVGNFPTGNPSGTIVYDLYVYNEPSCEQNSGSGNVDPADCWNSSGGPSDAQDVVVTDTLPLDPKKFVVQYVSPNCVYDQVSVPHKVTCEVADTDGDPIPLPAGAVAGPFQIQAVVKGSNGTFTNTATVTSTTTDPETVNNTDVVQTTVQGGTGKKGGGR